MKTPNDQTKSCADHPVRGGVEGAFTLGTWQLADGFYDRGEGDDEPRWDVHVEGAQTIALVYKESDARLIAAAPALYAALKLWIEKARFFAPDSIEYQLSWEQATAALALAERAGGQE